jgi:hypothetical protein
MQRCHHCTGPSDTCSGVSLAVQLHGPRCLMSLAVTGGTQSVSRGQNCDPPWIDLSITYRGQTRQWKRNWFCWRGGGSVRTFEVKPLSSGYRCYLAEVTSERGRWCFPRTRSHEQFRIIRPSPKALLLFASCPAPRWGITAASIHVWRLEDAP